MNRPVLSQSFEDDLEKIYRGKRNELPAFFANLIPEGPLRELIEKSLQLVHGDEMSLLEAVGQDLPGAVEITASEEELEGMVGEEDEEASNGGHGTENGEPLLRFSLAGVQLKFSVLREAERLTLPVRGQRGEWIAKLDSSRFPHLVRNELATLEWARAAGFEVPECHLQPASSLAAGLQTFGDPEADVLVIRRYDREDGRRIHQEDFTQVVGLPPRLKYDQISYEQCAALVRQIIGEEGYLEFIRRLAFVIASGNTDAHLKNWSLIYPDGVNAKLSPLYDQVCTIAWDEVPRVLSLRLSGKKHLRQIDEGAFARLAEKAGADADRTLSTLQDVLRAIADAWQASDIGRLMPPGHAATLRSYWQGMPLLKPYSAAFR